MSRLKDPRTHTTDPLKNAYLVFFITFGLWIALPLFVLVAGFLPFGRRPAFLWVCEEILPPIWGILTAILLLDGLLLALAAIAGPLPPEAIESGEVEA